MTIIEHSIRIHAPATFVSEVSQDYRVRYEWDPFPESISLVRGSMSPPTEGSQVLVRSKWGMQMLVEFIQVDYPHRAAIKMIRGPLFLAKFAGTWIFEDSDNHTSVARFRYTISSRPAILSWIGNRIAAAYFSRMTRQRLTGLKRYCEAAMVDNSQSEVL